MAKKVKINSFFKNKFLIALVVIGVAAGGAYAIINSRAATRGGAIYVESRLGTPASSTIIGEVGFRISSNDPANYVCDTGYANSLSGTTTNGRSGPIYCGTYDPGGPNGGKTYTIVDINKSGYSSNGNVSFVVQAVDNYSNPQKITIYITQNAPTPGPTPPGPGPTPPNPAPLPAIGLPGATTSCNTTTGQVTVTATFSGYGRVAPFNVDIKPQSLAGWSSGWFRQVNGSPVSLSSFNPWPTGSSGTLTVSPSTAYKLRIAYSGGSEHSGEILFTSVACSKAGGSGAGPTNPTPPAKKAAGSSSKVVARASTAAPTNPSDTIKPTAPANLIAEQIGNGEVELSWDESTDAAGIDNYTVERSSDGLDWTILDDAVLITSYSDTTADFGVTYSYRVSAKDKSGNFSDYAVVDIETNSFSANVYADEDSTITSEDNIVTVRFPSGSLSEDAYCEITKDTVKTNPKGYKLAAGGYIIECKSSQGDSISQLDKAAQVTMNLKSFKYKSYVAYSIDSDGKLEAIKSTFNSKSGELSFEISDMSNAFAAYGKSGGSSWWIWLIIILILILLIIAFIRWRRSRSESAEDAYYDSAGYVTMPPSAPVGPNGGGGGYEQHTSLPDMVAQGQQQQQNPQYQEFPPAPPLQGQPGEYPGQDPNQLPPQQPGPGGQA